MKKVDDGPGCFLNSKKWKHWNGLLFFKNNSTFNNFSTFVNQCLSIPLLGNKTLTNLQKKTHLKLPYSDPSESSNFPNDFEKFHESFYFPL